MINKNKVKNYVNISTELRKEYKNWYWEQKKRHSGEFIHENLIRLGMKAFDKMVVEFANGDKKEIDNT